MFAIFDSRTEDLCRRRWSTATPRARSRSRHSNLPPEEKPIELHTGSPDTSFDRLSSTSGRLARRILKASPRTDQPR